MISVTVNDSILQKRLKSFEETMSKTLGVDLRLIGKRMAFYAMEYTLPASNKGNAWPMEKFHERIAADVRLAYPTKGDDGWQGRAFLLIKAAYGEDRAKEFWNAYKSRTQDAFDPETGMGRNTAEAMWDKMFAARNRIPKKTNNEAYAALRNQYTRIIKRTLRMGKDTPPIAFVQEASRKAFTRKRQDTAGLAKAGWYAADTALGGTRNFTRAKNEAGRFVWPGPLRKLQNKFGTSIGSAHVSTSGSYGFVQVTNHVRYIDEAHPEHMQTYARKQMMNAVRIVFEQRYKAMGRKNFQVGGSLAA
jgi:hypothetical protein